MGKTGQMRALLAGLAVSCLVSACDSAPPTGTDAGPTSADAGEVVTAHEGTLELGTGATAFEPISDGDTVALSRGVQGLQHVWVSLRLREVDPELAITELTLTRVRDDAMVNEPFRARLAFELGTDGAELIGAQLVVPDEDAALGEPLVLRARVEARDGGWAEAEARIDIVPEDEL